MSTTVEVDLEKSLRRQEDKIRTLLSQTTWKRRWRPHDPELIKVLGLIHNRLGEISRLLIERKARPPANHGEIERRLEEMLNEDVTGFGISAAWEFSDSLRRLLLLLADESYIYAHLLNEKKGTADETGALKWGQFLDEDELKSLLKTYDKGEVPEADRRRAVECLSLVYSTRSNFGRGERAVVNMRERYLNGLSLVLLLLLALLLPATFLVANQGFQLQTAQGIMGSLKSVWSFYTQHVPNDPQVRLIIVAALAGGVGSLLSGFFKLRDEVVGIHDLQYFRAVMRAQPFVGATIGVLFYLLIASGIFSLGAVKAEASGLASVPWPLLATYCFFAGFSEPFFLGIVQRVAGTADKRGKGRKEQKESEQITDPAHGATHADAHV